jgi:hypothetical protein
VRIRLASLLLLVPAASACGGGDEPAATTAATPPPTTSAATGPATTETSAAEPKPPAGTPRFIARYRRWTKLNAEPIGPRDADPHLGTKEVYASAEMRANGRFPNGTVVVKEAKRPGRDFIGLLAIMRKERGADPAHNDWVFVEYTRERAGEPFAAIGSGAVCWSCHAGAADSEYVFSAG